MIRGLEHFKNYFNLFSKNFILIGGVATYLLLEEAGASRVRSTKDLDIVLLLEPEDAFLDALKEYIKLGGYKVQIGKNGDSTFYRFQNPSDDQYPLMIELFSSIKTDFQLFDGQHIVPISGSQGEKSLSAILLDVDYFSIIKKHVVEKDRVFIINELALIPFKAKAYLEIKERGEDTKNWKKHRSDIINLAVNFLTADSKEVLTGAVRDHFSNFIIQFKEELTDEIIRGACQQKISKEKIIELLESTFLNIDNK